MAIFSIEDDTISTTHENVELILNIDGDDQYFDEIINVKQAKNCKINISIKNIDCYDIIKGGITETGDYDLDLNNIINVKHLKKIKAVNNFSEIDNSYIRGYLEKVGDKTFNNCENIIIKGIINSLATIGCGDFDS